jgi:outer membrane protein insertion porin family
MRAFGAAMAAVTLVIAPRAASADVGSYIGRTVASVRLELEGLQTTDPKLLAVVETRPGRPLSMIEVRESVTHLFSLERFEDVEVHAALAGGRVALRYDLEPIHHVAGIEFAGITAGVDTGRLRRLIVDRFGVSPPVARAADVAAALADELRLRGFLHAAVVPRADIEHTPERATLVFTLAPGARTRIGGVTVVGTPTVSKQTLLGDLGVAAGDPYERDVLAQRIDRFVAGRRAKGFYEATVAPAVQLADNDRVANLTLNVAPGPRVRVVFAGDPLPSDKHAELVPVEREGSVDEDLLEDSSNRIEEYLRAQGYRDASAPHARVEANGELRITFTVKKGAQYRVSRVEISGNDAVPFADLAPGLRLRDGQPFSAAKLDADLAGIESLYHRRGFAGVKIESGLEQQDAAPAAGEILVLIRIAIREGARTLIGSVRIEGNQSVAEGALRPGLSLRAGQPFFLPQLALDRDAIQLQYANLGFQTASVTVNPGMSADLTRADIVFTVREGPRIFVDHVLIVGNVRTRTDTIERELQIKPGDPLGLEAVSESQRRLAALGLFRRTRITELSHGDETTRDLLVSVEEAPVTTVGYGGGFEALQVIRQPAAGEAAQTEIDFAPRAFVEVNRRNLFGKNRSINLFARVSPHLNPSGGSPSTPGDTGALGFTEYRALASFREPRVLSTGADASLTAVIEQQRRSSFNFGRKSFIAEAGHRVSRDVSISGSYQIQQTKLFDEQFNAEDKRLIDRIFPQVLLSSFSSSIVRDDRDDVVDPGSGGYLSANAQLAARRIGSEVGLAKTLFTAQMFRTLPHTNRIVLAANARVGLATSFPRDVIRTDAQGRPVIGSDGQPIVDRVADLPASERFFAGGDTMRGFALDQLGAPDTFDQDGFPLGGNALVLVNAELRAPVRGGLGVVGFFDTGNVFRRTAEIDLGELRSAIGFGLRYKSPVGPIRIDLGFKLHRHTIAGGRLEDLTAIHISLGQAF